MKKIGTLKGIPVVEGNVNEVTKNQIHYKENGGGIQLSKRNNDNKLNSITSGSSNGEGEGVKEYYYKTLDPNTIENIVSLITAFNGELLIDTGKNGIIRGSFGTFNVKTYNKIIGFKIYDIESYILNSSDGSYISHFGPFKGDVYEIFLQYSNFGGETGITIEQVKEFFSSTIQEITKEEYESMITYKS